MLHNFHNEDPNIFSTIKSLQQEQERF